MTTQQAINAKRRQIEQAMEDEIDSLMTARLRAVRSIGVAVAPPNHVQGKRVAGARYNYRKTQTWRPMAYRCERLERRSA
jgi:hypothetical protein